MVDQSPALSQQGTRHPFSFSGSGKEYFGIWIVNLLLSIVTLGIYTAWAKVRRLRYFYGNTWLDGHNFEYHAKPIQILIGRIIAVVLLVLLNVLAELFPLAALVLFIPYFLALPWLINKALQFNSRMSSYRNVRFGFKGNYLSALWIFIVLPVIFPLLMIGLIGAYVYASGFSPTTIDIRGYIILGILGVIFLLSILLIIPYVSKKVNEYIANNLSFGTAEFEAKLSLSKLFKNLFFVMIPVLVLIVIFAVVFGIAFGSGSSISADNIRFSPGLIFVLYLSVITSYFAYKAGVRNIAYNATKLAGGHDLESNLPRYGYAWVLISNLFVSVITIGLAIPWAAVRSWRYIANHTSLISQTDLDSFTANQNEVGNVAAAEYLDIDGIDFGL